MKVTSSIMLSAHRMLARSDVFIPEHYVFYQKDGGYHDLDAVQEYLYNALPLFLVQSESSFTEDTLISDVMNDPAFGDYGRMIFPVNSGYYGGDTLGDLSLTWYSYIDPDKTVEICNYMREHAANGDTIFYDIYTEEERAIPVLSSQL